LSLRDKLDIVSTTLNIFIKDIVKFQVLLIQSSIYTYLGRTRSIVGFNSI